LRAIRREGNRVNEEEEEQEVSRETARRVLQAAAVEAFGRPGVYVTRECVMERAAMVDLSLFLKIAQYLEDEGWIDEADADYGMFTVTVEGLDEAMR
jgi:hypothetical protein